MVIVGVTVDQTSTCSQRGKRFTLSPLWLCCLMWMSNFKDTTLDTLMISSGKNHNIVRVKIIYNIKEIKKCCRLEFTQIFIQVYWLSGVHETWILTRWDINVWCSLTVVLSLRQRSQLPASVTCVFSSPKSLAVHPDKITIATGQVAGTSSDGKVRWCYSGYIF